MFDGLPCCVEIVEVPLQFFNGPSNTRGTDDNTGALGDCEVGELIAEFSTIITLNTAGDAARLRIIRHEDQVASSQRDVCCESGSFGPTLFFFDLNDKLLAFLQDPVDFCSLALGGCVVEIFGRDFF